MIPLRHLGLTHLGLTHLLNPKFVLTHLVGPELTLAQHFSRARLHLVLVLCLLLC